MRDDAGLMIRAAGGVLWRTSRGGAIEVALVHRPRYGDWSLPKGKLRRGEHPLVTACREVAEETGIRAVAGLRLSIEHYNTAAGPKAVEYWAMHGSDGAFTATAEVDRVVWLPLAEARQRLSYERDTEALGALDVLEGSAVTAVPVVLLVRNGHAVPRGEWTGDDSDRPLDVEGREQAQALRRVVPAFGPSMLVSAPPARCAHTVAPLGADLAGAVGIDPAFGENQYSSDPRHSLTHLLELAAVAATMALCAPGVVIQHLLASLADDAGLYLPEIEARNGSVWALFFSDSRLAAADYYPALTGPQR